MSGGRRGELPAPEEDRTSGDGSPRVSLCTSLPRYGSLERLLLPATPNDIPVAKAPLMLPQWRVRALLENASLMFLKITIPKLGT